MSTDDVSNTDAEASLSSSSYEQKARKFCILPLTNTSHKGSSGRVGVLGGSALYTGAPYYAGMASLQAGADLAYIFTAEEAAPAIKSYSPELMVCPVYSATRFDRLEESIKRMKLSNDSTTDENQRQKHQANLAVHAMVQAVEPWMDRLHCLIIGPGLGRCPLVMQATARLIELARQKHLALVLDADALHLLSFPEIPSSQRSCVSGYSRTVLTPNAIEFKRLLENKAELNAVTLIVKGQVDAIYSIRTMGSISDLPEKQVGCTEEGGLKRSGGLGDILAGTLGTLLAWQVIMNESQDPQRRPLHWELACWTACCVVKRATRAAFSKKNRSMTAPDVLKQIGFAMNTLASDL